MRVTPEHWRVFLDIAERNPSIITNKFNGINGKAEGNAIWQTLTQQLNSLGYGQKSVIEWRKAVTDWKSKVKIKAAKIRYAQSQTGGGNINYIPLTPLEERLLELMGKKALEGDVEVRELGRSEKPLVQNALPSIASSCENVDSCELIDLSEITLDHSYIVQNVLETISSDKRSNSNDAENRPAKKQRKIRNTNGTSQKLLEMTAETLSVLKGMNQNMERIADSLQELTETLKGLRNKCI